MGEYDGAFRMLVIVSIILFIMLTSLGIVLGLQHLIDMSIPTMLIALGTNAGIGICIIVLSAPSKYKEGRLDTVAVCLMTIYMLVGYWLIIYAPILR